MCTGIRITADNGDIVYARTMEFDTPLPECIGYFPRGSEFIGLTSTGADGIHWKTKYAFGGNVMDIGSSSLGADGLNEKGLVAGVFNLPGFTEMSPVTDDNRGRALAGFQVVLYVLGAYATADEARVGLLAGDVVVVDTEFPITPTINSKLPLHLRIGDSSGKTYVCEWHTANEPPRILESPGGCITNLPRFEFHLDNWEHYKSLSPYNPGGPILPGGSQDYKITMGNGYVGMPGGSNSPDRFIRASLYSRDSHPGKTGIDAVWTAWHVMNNFDLPKGILRNVNQKGDESTEYTIWTSVVDTKNLKYYYRVYKNPSIYELDLNAQDPTGAKPLRDDRPASDSIVTVPALFA